MGFLKLRCQTDICRYRLSFPLLVNGVLTNDSKNRFLVVLNTWEFVGTAGLDFRFSESRSDSTWFMHLSVSVLLLTHCHDAGVVF